ncbi:hypothetical protein TIFTF001_033653 [Ficus carica]|uniref:Uncharacterized protein n=1 Tax=Ficus carica TaxID=3494 RepID=A0AA88DYY2_FICCA|nr:hypothetical protein TIFTF001_033653 [Ficus carica]
MITRNLAKILKKLNKTNKFSRFCHPVTKTVATPAITSGIVETPPTTSSATVGEFDDSESNCSSNDDLSDEDMHRAYKEMYNKLIQVCKINKSLEIHVVELYKEKDVLKKVVINYKFLAIGKERKFQEIRLQLENMQNSLKMLNSGKAKLEHILSIGKSSGDYHGLGYTGESSSSKTVIVKDSSIHEPSPQLGSTDPLEAEEWLTSLQIVLNFIELTEQEKMLDMFCPKITVVTDNGERQPTTVAECVGRAPCAECHLAQAKQEKAKFFEEKKKDKLQSQQNQGNQPNN